MLPLLRGVPISVAPCRFRDCAIVKNVNLFSRVSLDGLSFGGRRNRAHFGVAVPLKWPHFKVTESDVTECLPSGGQKDQLRELLILEYEIWELFIYW